MTIHYTAKDAVSALAQCRVAMRVVSEYHQEALALYPASAPFCSVRRPTVGVFDPDQGALLERTLKDLGLPQAIVVYDPPKPRKKRNNRMARTIEIRQQVLAYIANHGPCRRHHIRKALGLSSVPLDNALAWMRVKGKVKLDGHWYDMI